MDFIISFFKYKLYLKIRTSIKLMHIFNLNENEFENVVKFYFIFFHCFYRKSQRTILLACLVLPSVYIEHINYNSIKYKS